MSCKQLRQHRRNPPSGVVEASPSNPAPVQLENPGISDENDFAAVDSRRSIEDDAARRQQIASQYQVVEETALPQRQGSGPNIVQYALQSSNPLGNQMYRRNGLASRAKHERNCRSYPSADQAQIDFLARGGRKEIATILTRTAMDMPAAGIRVRSKN